LIIMFYRCPVSTLDCNAVRRKIRKTAIRLVSFVKVNSHFKVLFYSSTSIMPVDAYGQTSNLS
jgi:hypothetical protein